MSQLKIYVGNLSYNTTPEDLSTLFNEYGEIDQVRLITDKETGRSKGFAFVSFKEQTAAEAALVVNGKEFQGRHLRVNVAKEGGSGDRGDRGDRRGGGGFGGRGG